MITRINAGPRMSQIVTYPLSGEMVLLSGLCADDKNLDVQGQAKEVLAKIDALLEQAGTSKKDVVAAWIWLSDMGNFNLMNEVWDAWVAPGCAPVRATVGAPLADPGYLIEIQVQAVKTA